MICRLIDEKEFIFIRKEDRQHDPCTLSKAKRFKGPVKAFRIHAELVHLYQHLPAFNLRFPYFDQICGILFIIRFCHLIWKIIKSCTGRNVPAVLISAHEQIQKCCFSFSIPPDEAEFPVRINVKGRIFQNIISASVIGKRKVCHLYLCHDYHLLSKTRG